MHPSHLIWATFASLAAWKTPQCFADLVCPDSWHMLPGKGICYRAFELSTGRTFKGARSSCRKSLDADPLFSGVASPQLLTVFDANAALRNMKKRNDTPAGYFRIEGYQGFLGGKVTWLQFNDIKIPRNLQFVKGQRINYGTLTVRPTNGNWYGRFKKDKRLNIMCQMPMVELPPTPAPPTTTTPGTTTTPTTTQPTTTTQSTCPNPTTLTNCALSTATYLEIGSCPIKQLPVGHQLLGPPAPQSQLTCCSLSTGAPTASNCAFENPNSVVSGNLFCSGTKIMRAPCVKTLDPELNCELGVTGRCCDYADSSGNPVIPSTTNCEWVYGGLMEALTCGTGRVITGVCGSAVSNTTVTPDCNGQFNGIRCCCLGGS